MPRRDMALARAGALPNDVLIQLARDPDAFEARLLEFDQRKTAAEETERVAGERKSEAEGAR